MKSGPFKLILLGLVACVTPYQMFAPAYMKLGDIKGEVTTTGYKDAIEIESFSLGAANAPSATGGAGKVSFSDISFVKQLDASSPLLYLNSAKGQPIPTATFHLTRTTGAGQEEFYTITLSDVLISSVQTSGSADSGAVPTESFSLNFSKIEFSYHPRNPAGGLGTAVRTGWDVKNNVEIRPGAAN